MKELLHILQEKPELNKQLNSQSDYELKTLIIQAYIHNTESSNSEVLATYTLRVLTVIINSVSIIHNLKFLDIRRLH